MRCRGAKFLSSTCAASTAVSSASSSANSGTCFNTSGLQDIGHLFCGNWNGSQSFKRLIRAQLATAAPIVNPMQVAASTSIREKWEKRGAETRKIAADASGNDLNLHVLRRGMLRQQRGHSLRPALQSFRAAKRNDDCQHALCRARHHRALRIARRAAVRTNSIGEQRQSFQIQIVLADALVRFARAPRTKNNFAHDVSEII